MSKDLITADDLFGEFRADPAFVAEQRRLAARTNLAINVNLLRMEKGWTQERLAREAGMKQPRIAEVERGDANPQLDTITRLAIALDVAESELLRQPGPAGADTTRRLTLRVVANSERGDLTGWGPMQQHFKTANDNFALAG